MYAKDVEPKQLVRWRDDKPIWAGALLHLLAANAGMLYSVIQLPPRQVALRVARADPETWLQLYWNSQRVCDWLLALFLSDYLQRFADVFAAFEEREKSPASFNEFGQDLRLLIGDFVNEFSGGPFVTLSEKNIDTDTLDTNIAAAYYLFVFLPCVLRFRAVPCQLLWKARRGDVDALEDLLHLDLSVLEDRRIRDQIYRIRLEGKPGDRRRINKALDGKGMRALSRKKFKANLISVADGLFRKIDEAGELVEQQFPGIHVERQRLTSPQSKGAFDAVAKDMTGDLEDPDLPVGETLYKLLQRSGSEFLTTEIGRTISARKMSG